MPHWSSPPGRRLCRPTCPSCRLCLRLFRRQKSKRISAYLLLETLTLPSPRGRGSTVLNNDESSIHSTRAEFALRDQFRFHLHPTGVSKLCESVRPLPPTCWTCSD